MSITTPIDEHAMDVSVAIGVPLPDWVGNCSAIAHKMIEEDLVDGVYRYGHWHGPIGDDTPFAGRPFTHHAWIETPDGVVDPTRWTLTGEDPYIYAGPNDFYDVGGNYVKLATMQAPPAFDPSKKTFTLDLSVRAMEHAWRLLGHYDRVIDVRQLHWLCDASLYLLYPYAEEIYRFAGRHGLMGFVPQDNQDFVLNDSPARRYPFPEPELFRLA